jgi:hypothetical protein
MNHFAGLKQYSFKKQIKILNLIQFRIEPYYRTIIGVIPSHGIPF